MKNMKSLWVGATKLALTTSLVIGGALLTFEPSAKAATFELTGNANGSTVDLFITSSNALNTNTGGYDITGITGSISGYGSVDPFSGIWPNNNDVVSSGLYVNPNQGQVPPFNLFTVQNPLNSGGANVSIDNVWLSTDPHLTYAGGVAFLIAVDGTQSHDLTGYISAASASGSAGWYYLFLGNYDKNDNFNALVSEVFQGGFQDTTPLPAALPLFASGLGALGLLGWRRKRKAALAA
jgi:hypothetical protein